MLAKRLHALATNRITSYSARQFIKQMALIEQSGNDSVKCSDCVLLASALL